MRNSEKNNLISFSRVFRILIAAVFLFGMLPIPVLAVDNGTLAGQVTDSSTTNPIPGATILVTASGSQIPGWNGNTDQSGNYTLQVPADTGYQISAFKEGYVTGNIGGQNVTANTTTTVNFQLTPGGIIQGTVSDNTSNPIQNADVRAYLPASPENTYFSLPTDSSGQYSITVPPGAGYTVEANSQGFSTANQTGISAALGTPVTVDFTLMPPPPPPENDTTPPANVTDLATGNVTAESVFLTWTAPGDDGATGQATEYEVRYAASIIDDDSKWNAAQPAGNPPPPPPGSAGSNENFMVGGLSSNTTYFFAIKTRDNADLWSTLSNSPSAKTSPPPLTPYFVISHDQNKSSFMLAAGDNITETFNITSVNDFEGTINLNIGGPPEIENNSSVSPSQVTLSAGDTVQVTANIGAGLMMPSGSFGCGLGGQTSAYGGQQKGFFFTVIIGVPGQPMLSASPPVIAAGNQTSFFASQFPADEAITLKWDSGPSSGVTLASGQVAGDGTWNVQVPIPADMPGGNFMVKATAGQSAAVCELTITSGSGEDFLMSTSPHFVSLTPGQSANVTVYITSINGFSSPVTLTAGSAPGITTNLSTGTVTPSSGETTSAVLTITTADWTSPEMYQINVDGSGGDPPMDKVTNINVDIQPPAEWGPGISLSQSYAMVGDTITITGANFPPACDGQTVTVKEAFSDTILNTNPATLTVNNGSFTGTFIVPSDVPSGNYRIKAIVESTGDFAERDFQIMGTGETFTLDVSPQSTTVVTEQGENSSTISVNIFSIGGNSPSVNLALEGNPNWLTYQFGSLPINTAVSGNDSISVPAGGSASRNLILTAAMTAPTGSYSISVKGWVEGGSEQRVPVELVVQPPAGFGMTQFTLSPTYGQANQTVNFSGSGFEGCTPSQVTQLEFGPVNLITMQNLPTINVPTTGDSAGRLSGSFRVPDLPSGTYWVNLSVGTFPDDTVVTKSFTITGLNDTFVLQASPSFLWTEQGTQISTMIKVQSVGSSSPTINLSVEGCPADITTSFASGNITAPPGGMASTDLNLNIAEWMPSGHYSFMIKGQRAGNDEIHRIPIEIDVVPPAGFGMASIYLNPTVGSTGTWITISGSGFPPDTALTSLYFGPPNLENDQVANGTLPAITTDGSGAFSAVLQVPSGLTGGMYPIEAVVGTYPDDRRAMADFNFVSDQASFTFNLSPMIIQTPPGTPVPTSVNIQSVGASSANITLRVEGPPNIEWRFDGGAWQTPVTVSPPIGSTLVSSLEIQPKASTPMGHYSLAVKAASGEQIEIRNLELDVGASADYGMPIFSLNPNNGMAGTNVSFSGSNFPTSVQISGITFGTANITLGQTITTSPQGTFSGAFTVPATIGGQSIAPGTYFVRVYVGQIQAESPFNVYSTDDTFTLSLSPNFLQGEPGGTPVTSGILKALGGASPTVKMAIKGLPPGVNTRWNGNEQQVYNLNAPPGGQNNFELMLVLPGMIPMGQYQAVLEGWVDENQNDAWDEGEKIKRVNLEISIMPPQGYNMGMLSLTPTYGQVGDTITFAGSGFPADTAVDRLIFAETDILTNPITTSSDGSFSGVFIVPDTAFGMPTGPGRYPVDVVVGSPPNDVWGGFDFQVVSSDQKFSVSASPGWLARPAGDTAHVSIAVRSLVTTPPSPTIIVRIEGLPMGVTPSFTSANVTPAIGDMESRELQLTISSGCPMGNYPISVRAYNAANPDEEMWTDFTLEVTPSSDYMDMGMASLTLSPNFGAVGSQVTVSGYGFPKDQDVTQIRLGSVDVTPGVTTTTDSTGAFSAVITVPTLPSGFHPIEVNVQNTIRMMPYNIMGDNDTFSIKVSPNWLEPIPAGDPNGREIAITITGLPGKTPTVSLNTEGLYTPSGTITENWVPASKSVSVTNAGGSATGTLTLLPSENVPPGPYPFTIVAVDGSSNRRDYYMELQVGPPANYMDETWMTENGVFFPEIYLSPKSGPAGTQVTFTGTDMPVGANVTSINFAGYSVPIPSSGITADSNGGFSGSFIVNESWNLPPGGMYWVDFHMETETWWQNIGKDFQLMRPDATFSLEATPNWIPPIPIDGYGQTNIKVKALGYNSANVTLAVMEQMAGWGIPGNAQIYWNSTTNGTATTIANVPGNGQTSKTLYVKGVNPGYFMITIVGWIDSNDNQILDKEIQSEAESEFSIPLDFDVQSPQDYMNWDQDAMMDEMGMGADDMYLFYFPEIVLNPNIGPADTKVTINATDFPASANVTHLRFAGMEMPVPSNTVADSNGDFTLVFNVPKTIWGGNIGPGWYDIEVEAQKPGEAPVFIMKPFQVTSSDVAFTLRADPDWLPPIPPEGNATTLIRVKSLGSAANVTLTMDRIPPGVTANFSSTEVNVSPGGSNSATLTLTPTTISSGHYFAEIKGTATIGGVEKIFFTHLEFDVEPPQDYMNWDKDAMMDEMGMSADDMYLFYFPEIVLNPNMGPAGKKVTINATDFPAGANVTRLRFAGMDLPVPAGTAANENGEFTLVFNVPKTIWGGNTGPGWYDVEVGAQKPGEPPIFIMKPFQVISSDVAFTMRAEPNWLPPIPPNGNGMTNILINSIGAGANVTLSMDKIPPGVTSYFSSTKVNLSPGGSGSVSLTLTPTTIPTGHYGAEIKGTATISGVEKTFFTHIEFDVEPPRDFMNWDKDAMMNDMGMATDDMYLFYFPEIVLNPNMGQAGTKVTIAATDFPAGANVTRLRFAGMDLPVPAGTAANENGDFTLVFNVPKTIWGGNIGPGWYDVEVEAQKPGEPPIFIMKPFQVITGDVAFTMRAEPDWLPPIPPSGSSTTIRINSLGSGANVTISMDKIPPGITSTFSSTEVNVPPGGSGSVLLTLTPTTIPPAHYGAEIKGTAIIGGIEKTFYTHIEFDVEPPQDFLDWDRNAMMNDMGMATDDMYFFYFPEIVLNPNMGQAGKKVTITATDFPAGANVTHLRFAGMDLPVPAGTAANENGDFTLVFNVPKTIWGGNIGSGWYDVEVEAQKPGEPPIFIMKPFQVITSDVAFTMRAEPDWLPPIPPSGSTTTIRINSLGSGANVTLSMDKKPPGITATFSSTQVNVPPGGSGSATLTLTPTSIPPGHYGAEIKGTATIGGIEKTTFAHIEFDVEPPQDFMDWDRDAMMNDMGMAADDMYLFYFPEIVLNPNMGQAGTKVTIAATDFPAGADVTHLRFAGMDLPVPDGLVADNNGDFTLVFNVPKTIWDGNIGPGWYDVEVEAQKAGEPPVFIMKPFELITGDVAFTMRAEPDWLPPIPPEGSATTIRVKSMGSAANVTLSVDRIPPGITTTFSSTQINVPPGGSGSATLTLTPTSIPPGHYGAEIKGTATIGGVEKTFFAHIEFDVEPAMIFKDTDWMEQQGIWFPEITLNPTAGPAKTKVTVKATDFPVGAEITHLRFAGRELPIPANTVADSDGNVNLVFNVPGDFGIGQYMVEVEAQKSGMQPVFIAKPFFIQDSGVTFNLNVVPGFIPGVEQGSSGDTTIFVESTGQAVTVELFVDGLPSGVTGTFESPSIVVPPGGSGSTKLTITTRASTPPGQYPLTIRGVKGDETRMIPFGFGVTPPASFQVPKFTISPDYAPAGYSDKQYKITFSGTGFPASQRVVSLEFGSQQVAIPANLSTDALGNFNGVFQMPTGLTPGTYDVRVTVETLAGGYVYDSRPFSIRGAEAKFILKTSPPYLPPTVQGGQATTNVNVQSVGTTSANVTLSVEGLAPGITAAFTPGKTVYVSPGGAGSATLTISVSTSTPPGPYPLDIRGVSGDESITIPLGFSVMPDIGDGEGHATITINPAQARPGEHVSISGAGFTGNSTITMIASPPGASVAMDITPGTITAESDGTWATEITVPEASEVPPGTYIIKASDGLLAAKTQFSIVPATGADFFLNVSPQFIEVIKGQSGNTTMKLSSKNGFKEPVFFNVGHLVPGVTATFKDSTGTTISQFVGAPGGIRETVSPIAQTPVPGEDMIITVLVEVDVATPEGPYDIPLEVTTATIARAVPLGLMVTSAGANINISPQSGPSDTDITISGSGYTAGENVTITFAGNSITTVPSTITVAQDGTFTAIITTPAINAGIYPVRATGDTSGTTVDRPFSLKPSAVNSFVLYTSPMKVDISKGSSRKVTAKMEPLGNFQSPITLSISGLNAISGATANISPSATITPNIGTPTTATLTINIPAGAIEGKYPLVITGTSGAITQTRTITVKVVPPANTPDFGISLAPNTIPVNPNSSGNTTVSVTAINGFSGTVDLSVSTANQSATWPSSISYTANSVTPSANTGLGKQTVVFTADADTQPGTCTFRITGTSGNLTHSADVMLVCTPSGTTVTEYASPRLDPTTVTSSTPIDMEPPWGDKITINGIINDGAEASVITPAKVDTPPDTLADLPEGATDMLGRITNVESSTPVDGVEWDIGFPYDPDTLAAAGLDEENLKVAYLNPDTGVWTEVTTTVDTTNKIAYASPEHFSSWTLLATPAPPPSEVVTAYTGGGGGGGGSMPGLTSISQYVAANGKFIQTVTASSFNQKVKVEIPMNTIGKNEWGQLLYAISIQEQAVAPAAPDNGHIVSLVYDIWPSGATFDPSINLTFSYNDSFVPAGTDEEDLVIATWQDGTWIELDGCIVDPVGNTVTAAISHFSLYAIITRTAAASFKMSELTVTPTEALTEESVTVSTTVTNTGNASGSYEVTLTVGDSVIDTKQVDLAENSSQDVSFTLTLDKSGTYTIDVNGLTATLTVKEAPADTEEETSEEPVEVEEPASSETELEQPEESAPVISEEPVVPVNEEEAPSVATPTAPETPIVPKTGAAPTRSNSWLIFLGVVAAGIITIGIAYWRTRVVRRRI